MQSWMKWSLWGLGIGGALALLGWTSDEATTYDEWGVPFAKGRGAYWPVVTPNLVMPTGALAFYASRSSGTGGPRHHAGVDVIAANGEFVRACEDGVLVGHAAGYVGLDALVIRHSKCSLLYGEMIAEAGLRAGDAVSAGQVIGRVVTSRGSSPGAVASSMLHFEAWEIGSEPTMFTPWYVGKPAPAGLLDPTLYLTRTLESVR